MYNSPGDVTGSTTTGNPLQPVYQGAPPQVTATTSNADVSPTSAIQQLQSANALTNAQQNNNLSSLLASEGITGNDATAAQGALSSQLMAAEAPSLASLITNAQGLGLNQSEFNAGAANQDNALNLSSILGVNSANQNAANSAGNSLASYLMNNYGMNLGAFTNILDAGLGGAQSLNSGALGGQISLANGANSAGNQQTSNNLSNFISMMTLLGGGA